MAYLTYKKTLQFIMKERVFRDINHIYKNVQKLKVIHDMKIILTLFSLRLETSNGQFFEKMGDLFVELQLGF